MIDIKSKREMELMREACKITAMAHYAVAEAIKPGMTTKELDKIAESVILKNGAIPSFKNYPSGYKDVPNFPATACISINDEVIHGIPSETIIKNGDIVSVDLGAYKNGFHGDMARTIIVGEVAEETKRLVEVTKQAFYEGIKFAKPGYRVGDIGNAIGNYIEKNGFSIVKEFQGHGVGRNLHEEPGVPNYGQTGKGLKLEPGMTLAIEPMVNIGSGDILELENGWTIITEDGSLSAHYENTILITEKEPEILTI